MLIAAQIQIPAVIGRGLGFTRLQRDLIGVKDKRILIQLFRLVLHSGVVDNNCSRGASALFPFPSIIVVLSF
jgi:hypothetical protein